MSPKGVSPGRGIWERLELLLHREANAVALGHRELLALPVEERVERGECLAGLRLLGEETDGAFRLECRENLSKWRRGDGLRLRASEGEEGVKVVYEAFDAEARVLRVRRSPWGGAGEVDGSATLRLDPEPVSLHEVALEAIRALRSRRDAAAESARAVLEGRADVSIAEKDEEHAEKILAAPPYSDLEESKRAAFVAAVAKRPVALVQGPPGSGKTYLAALAVSALARRGERVLVTAFTHRAVNQVLRKLAEADPVCDVVKVGPPHGADDLEGSSVRTVLGIGSVPPPPPRRPQVVGAVVLGLRKILGAARFDRVVFDEAAQVPLAIAPCGFAVGSRFLLVGDHRQLGPIVQGEHDDPLASLSIFEYLAPEHEPSLLRTTWRMNDGINAFPSRHFYGGRLEPHADAALRRFPLVPGGPFDDVFDPERPAVFATVHHDGFRTRCEPEARAVAALVEDLIARQGLPSREVAVVSPFRAQIREIRTLLKRALRPAGKDLPVVDTVERIQGQEREAVVVSLTASDPEHLSGEQAAFFFSPNRLNVTLTRARTKLVLVASGHLFRALPPAFEDLRNADLFRRLYRELPRVDLTSRCIGDGNRIR